MDRLKRGQEARFSPECPWLRPYALACRSRRGPPNRILRPFDWLIDWLSDSSNGFNKYSPLSSPCFFSQPPRILALLSITQQLEALFLKIPAVGTEIQSGIGWENVRTRHCASEIGKNSRPTSSIPKPRFARSTIPFSNSCQVAVAPQTLLYFSHRVVLTDLGRLSPDTAG